MAFKSNYDDLTLLEGTTVNDTLANHGSYVTVDADSGNDEIDSFSDAQYVTLFGGSGKDSIWTWSDYSFVIDAEGDNYLYNGGNKSTILAGEGNDRFINYGEHAILYGGEGNDFFENTSIGDYATIMTAEGNDTVSLSSASEGVEIWYFDGDGDDVVTGQMPKNATLSVVDVPYTASEVGNDIVVKAGTGSITFKNMAGQDITIDGTLSGGSSSASSSSSGSSSSSSSSSSAVTTTTNSAAASAEASVATGTATVINQYITVVDQSTTDNSTHTDNSVHNTSNIVGDGNTVNNGDNNSTGNTTNNSTNNSSNTTTTTTTTDNSVTTTTTDNSTHTTTTNNITNNFTYNGGNKVINNYKEGDVIQLTSDYQGIDLQGNSFFVKSSSGQLEIQDSRDKFIGYSGGDDNVVAYSYVASGDGQVDGRGKNQAEIMIGGDNANNQMYAGSGGSSLWGGNGGNDTLTGGNGYDEFFYAIGSGADVIQNAGDNDVVNLLGVSLSQITYAEVNYSSVNIGFVDGGSLSMQSSSATGFRVEGVTYAADRSTGSWYTK